MEEKTGLEILIENLMELGLNPDTHVVSRKNILSGRDRFLSTTSVIVQLSDSMFFLARAGVSHTFTGIYSSIKLPIKAEYKVYNRNWFDFIFFPKKQKVGVKYIDENLTIVSPRWIPSKELNLENANLFLEINKAGKPYKLVVENNYFSLIEPLKDKKIIGIETNNWLCEKEDLKNLLDIGSKLIRKMVDACL
ncbi:MAG: hypothetical protein FWF09_07380 [Bacteroidales bacterium]|nr:hypothetical protein [Bacteroidales bacterium]